MFRSRSRSRLHDRRSVQRNRDTWRRLGWFAVAGATGYVVNIAVFAAGLHGAQLDYRMSAVVAFAVALATTFVLNRRFTFQISGGPIANHVWRYFLVSLVAFGANLAVLNGLVAGGVTKLAGQAVAVAVAAPVNFAGQRLWAFAEPDPGERPRTSPRVWIALAAMVAVGALLRFWHLGTQGLWWDEATSGWLIRGGLGHVAPAVARSESTPPLYYLLAWGWTHVFGAGAVGLRSFSAVAGLATVPAAFAAGRTLATPRIGLIAAALVAVNPFLVWYSQEARAYALLALLSTIVLWMFARARERPSARRHVAWGVAAALALVTHYFAFFALLPEAVLLLADRRVPIRRRLIGPGVAALGGIALAALVVQQTGAHALWFTVVPLATRIGEIGTQFLVGFAPPATTLALVVALVATAGGFALLGRAAPPERRAALIAGTVAIIAAGVPIALALAGADFLNSRNVIPALVPAAIALACGLGGRRAGLVGVGVTVVLVVVSVAMVRAVQASPDAQRTHWNQVAAALRRPAGSPPRLILTESSRAWERSLGFYLPDTWFLGNRTVRVGEIDVVRRLPDPHSCLGRAWWGAACHIAPRRHGDHRLGLLGFRLAATTRVAGFEIARWTAPHAVTVRGPLPGGGKSILSPSPQPLL